MGKIIISTNVTLDGVVQDPDGKEGLPFGGWFVESGGADLAAWSEVSLAEALEVEAVLLGRRSDEWFGPRWNTRDGEWADRLNSLPKYVVSSSTEAPKWSNGTLLDGDDAIGAVTKLKHELTGDIVVYASYQLGRALLEHDLVDEVRLTVFPVVVAAGERLFGEGARGKKAMRLVKSATIGKGLVHLSYLVDA